MLIFSFELATIETSAPDTGLALLLAFKLLVLGDADAATEFSIDVDKEDASRLFDEDK